MYFSGSPRAFTRAELNTILAALGDAEAYGTVLRAKGMVANAEGEGWLHFDMVPEEIDIRTGKADIHGKLCVIGSKLDEAGIAKLFGV